MGRSYFLGLLASALAFAIAVSALNAWVDPFEHYRKPRTFAPRFYPAWQRYQDPGLARHWDYDRVVTGSSIMENIDTGDVDRALGGRSINLAESAQTAYDAARLLRVALDARSPKQVIMGIDYNGFSGAPDRSGFGKPLPGYLYDDALWNDLPYLIGVESTGKSIETLLGLSISGFNTDPARMWQWGTQFRYSAADAVRGLDPRDLNARFYQSPRTLAGMQACFEENLAPLLEAYPATRFTFVLPPVSILVWSDFRQRDQVEVTLAFREWLFERTRRYPNAEIFDFQAEPAIVTDLDHYTDIYHYSPRISRAMIDAIADGRYRLTPEALAANDAWLRRMAREVDPAKWIAEARARPEPSAEQMAHGPPGGYAKNSPDY